MRLMSEEMELPCPRIVHGQQELTTEQRFYVHHLVQKHMSAILKTLPGDETEAEEHLRWAYQVAGLKPPVLIRWFDSPMALVQEQRPDRGWKNAGISVRDCVLDTMAS